MINKTDKYKSKANNIYKNQTKNIIIKHLGIKKIINEIRKKINLDLIFINDMRKDYKVEMKGSYWEVIISTGCYSDFQESHLVFAGNSEDEIWDFLKRYTDDVLKESTFCWGLNNGTCYLLKWGNKKYISKKYTDNVEDISWNNSYDSADVKIKRLDVIYFKR